MVIFMLVKLSISGFKNVVQSEKLRLSHFDSFVTLTGLIEGTGIDFKNRFVYKECTMWCSARTDRTYWVAMF
jgi:hypothetical protein